MTRQPGTKQINEFKAASKAIRERRCRKPLLKSKLAAREINCTHQTYTPMNQLLVVQLEIMKLKMEKLESKCAKKDLEILNLKQETDEKKDIVMVILHMQGSQ